MDLKRRFVYSRLKKAIEKKATEYYQRRDQLKSKEKYIAQKLIMEGFHEKDILIVVVIPQGAMGQYKEQMKLSENADSLNIFMSRIKQAVEGFDKEIYSKLSIDFLEKEDEINVTYLDVEGEEKVFRIKDYY